MALTLSQLLYGIRMVETSGRKDGYGIVNSIGAVGAYQVMKSNIPSWTREALGHSMTWQQFRDSPASQNAVALYKLNQYMKRYGSAEAAAAMWFSGQPNPDSQRSDGYNTVAQYVAKMKNYASGYSASGNGLPGGENTYTGSGKVTPKLDSDELAAQYGLTSALINSSAELKKLFSQAVSGGWSAAKFQASLKNTKWWKTQSSTLRQYLTMKYTDPATWTQNRKAAAAKLNSLAVQVGLGNQLKPGGAPTKLLDSAMYYSLALGWSDQRIKDWFGARVNLNGDFVGGEAGETWDKLHELTYLNGMKFSDTWMKTNTRSVIAGKSTLQTLEDYIRRTAAARYGAYADQIKAGMNVMDLAAPYIKATAGILELAESDIDLFNPHIAKAMTAKQGIDSPAGSGAQMPLWQFENELREDPLWKKTNNAREGMMTVARQVAKDFGVAY